MEGQRRPVVLHIHLFKNAGTSVDAGLESHFGDAWMSHDRSDQNQFGDEYLRSWLRERPKLAAFSSHQFRPPLDGANEFDFLPIVFLRHPLDRIRSAFDFERNQGAITPSSTVAATENFAGWLEFHRSRNSAQCSDFHVSSLSTLRWRENQGLRRKLPKEQHLASAQEFLRSLPTFGIVEDYDASWTRITMMIQSRFSNFNAGSAKRNLTEGRLVQLDERLSQMKHDLGESGYEQLVEENSFDLELYRWAGEELAR